MCDCGGSGPVFANDGYPIPQKDTYLCVLDGVLRFPSLGRNFSFFFSILSILDGSGVKSCHHLSIFHSAGHEI